MPSTPSSQPTLPALLWDDEPRPEDIEAVRGLVYSTGVFSPEEVRVAGELVAETLSGDDADYAFVFARTKNSKKLAGYACFGEIPLTEGRYDLYWIAANPSYHSLGIGHQLLKRVEQRIRNTGGVRIYAETSGRADYAPAHRFYLRHGFTEIARLPHFYRLNDDKVVFEKDV